MPFACTGVQVSSGSSTKRLSLSADQGLLINLAVLVDYESHNSGVAVFRRICDHREPASHPATNKVAPSKTGPSKVKTEFPDKSRRRRGRKAGSLRDVANRRGISHTIVRKHLLTVQFGEKCPFMQRSWHEAAILLAGPLLDMLSAEDRKQAIKRIRMLPPKKAVRELIALVKWSAKI